MTSIYNLFRNSACHIKLAGKICDESGLNFSKVHRSFHGAIRYTNYAHTRACLSKSNGSLCISSRKSSENIEPALPSNFAEQKIPKSFDELGSQITSKVISPPDSRLLKVAVIGVPNAGKSTLINKIIGYKVCCVSSKVHTTVGNVKAACVEGSTQVIFLDTPGVVTVKAAKKYNLKRDMLTDPETSLEEADLIAVIHDSTSTYSSGRLLPQVMRLLCLYPQKPAILLINKVDRVPNKEHQMGIISALTLGKINGIPIPTHHKPSRPLTDDQLLAQAIEAAQSLKQPNRESDVQDVQSSIEETKVSEEPRDISLAQTISNELKDISSINREDIYAGKVKLNEHQIKKFLASAKGWPMFKQVFLTSGITGHNIEPVREYLLSQAHKGDWLFNPTMITDQTPEEIVIMTVREQCLENLSNNLPYELKIQVGYWNLSAADSLNLIVNVYCMRSCQIKIFIGPGGEMVKLIAQKAEEELKYVFKIDVRLRINFNYDPEMKNQFKKMPKIA